MVTSALLKFVQKVYTMGKAPWQGLVDSFGRDPDALRHSPVVLISKEHGQVKRRVLTYSIKETKVWGVAWQCGGAGCTGLPGDLTAEVKHLHWQARFTCRKCGWKTWWVDPPTGIHPVDDVEMPFVYHHPFPPTAAIKELQKAGMTTA